MILYDVITQFYALIAATLVNFLISLVFGFIVPAGIDISKSVVKM